MKKKTMTRTTINLDIIPIIQVSAEVQHMVYVV